MFAMTDPAAPTSTPATPDPIPGERRLAHPPSDRYRTPEPETPTRPVSPGRGLAYAAIVGIVGAVMIVVLGGVLTLTGGLFVVAAVIGYATAWALRVGGGSTIGDRRRAYLALGLALASVALGQLGLWLYALTEGGVLSLLDYLAEAFGPLVPIQAVIAGLVAWVTAR
jgi:hypothetical protein